MVLGKNQILKDNMYIEGYSSINYKFFRYRSQDNWVILVLSKAVLYAITEPYRSEVVQN